MSKFLYFIDTKLSEYQTIIDSLSSSDTYYLINSDSDGLTQMATILSGYSNLDALHIYSHGSIGSLNLGNTILNQDNISSYESLLQSIGNSLTTNGDVLLYGCNVAQGGVGQSFIDTIATYTGADVAASNDATGSSILGGDWVLETTSGIIETTTIEATTYNGILVDNTAPTTTLKPSIGLYNDYGMSNVIQGDGKILVSGYMGNGTNTDFALVRYNTDGSLDTTFGIDGMVSTAIGLGNDQAYSVTIQADGKILVAGYTYNGTDNDFALIRYNTDGSLDTAFDADGILTTAIGSGGDTALSVTIQSDQKIIAAGYSFNGSNIDFALVRYNTDGTLDSTFGVDGKVSTPIGTGDDYGRSVTLQDDGKILLAGYSSTSPNDFALVRYNTDGSLDTTFDSDGKLTTAFSIYSDLCWDVALQADGKILAAGYGGIASNYDIVLVRYNTDGTLDTTFSADGIVTTAIGTGVDRSHSVTVQPDGKILIAGYAYNSTTGNDFVLVRYNIDGSLDTTFDTDGIVTTDIGLWHDQAYSVTVQADGKIVVSGNSLSAIGDYDFAVIRYNSDGSLDTSFGYDGKVITAIDAVTFIENGSPVIMDSTATVYDAELSALDNYSGATLILHGNYPGDQFSGAGIVAGSASGDVTTSGIIVGTYSFDSLGLYLFITFNSNATQALVNQTMQSLAYSTTSENPSSSELIGWYFEDGNTGSQGNGGALGVNGITYINITPINDAPVVSAPSTLGSISYIGSFSINETQLLANATDIDSTLSVINLTSSNGTVINNNNGTWTVVPNSNYNGTITFNYAVTDGVTAVSTTATLGVIPNNTAPTFNIGDGIVTTPISSSSDVSFDVKVQADGKIVVAGYAWMTNGDFAIVRYETDGSLDATFGNNGKVTTDMDGHDQANSIAIQSDGKIILAGTTSGYLALARYNIDGSLDTTFSGDGKFIYNISSPLTYSVVVQPDGKILVAGTYAGSGYVFILLRYNSDGTLDTTFNNGNGMVTNSIESTEAYSVALQSDGKILVAGDYYNGSNYDFALVRYNSDGTLDATFSGDGKVTTAIGTGDDIAYDVTVQSDGKILLAGKSANGTDYNFALARYNTDGSLDTTFSSDGILTTAIGSTSDTGKSVVVQADGKILIAGYSVSYDSYLQTIIEFALVRYTSDGSLDTTFGGDGKVTVDVGTGYDYGYGVTLQLDGKILVTGSANGDFGTVRLNSDGSLDTTFGNNLISTSSYIENGAAFVLDSTAHIYDAELSALDNYAGATLTLARNGIANSQDQFSGSGIVAGQTSGNVTTASTVVGTYTYVNGSLIITFNSNATQTLVNQTLQSIAYNNTSDAPPASVQIDWTFNDGNTGSQGDGGTLSVTDYTIINITAVNDAPFVAITAVFTPVAEDSGAITITEAQLLANATDAEGDSMSVSAVTASAGTLVDNNNGTWTLTPTANYNGTITLDYTISDGQATVATTATQVVTPVNNTPTGSVVITGIMVEGKVLSATNTLADLDGIGSIDYQWYANGEAIVDAIQATYLLTTNEIGKTIMVQAHFTDGNGTQESILSRSTVNIIASNMYFLGNELANTLIGNSGNNILDGGAGADTMIGGLGNDTYYVDNLKDIVKETATGGNDTVYVTMDTGFVGKFTNIENVYGSTGNDTVTLGTAQPAGDGIIDLGDGIDKLTLAAGTNNLTVSNVETVIGNTGADTVALGTLLTTGSVIDLAAGTDRLTLLDGNNTATLKNIETIIGGTGADTITLGKAQASGTIDLGDGNDTLTIMGVSTLSILNVETINGSALADTLTLKLVLSGTTVDLGAGVDKLTLAAGTNSVTVANIETLIGNTGNDTVLVTTVLSGTNSIDLGAGTDSVTLADGGNTVLLKNIETINGGTGDDTVKLGTAQPAGNAIMDLGAGTDKLTLAAGTNNLTVSNVETLIGNTGADTVALGTLLTTGSVIDLGAGIDKLTLLDGTNTATLKNIETIIGGTGADTITLGKAQTVGTINLGDGTDTLILANGTNKLTVSNIEAIIGGTGADTITVTGSTAVNINGGLGNDILTGGDGDDIINGGVGNDILTGGLGNDTFVFNTTLNSTTNKDTIKDFTVGQDTIQFNHAVFTQLASGTLSADNFIANSTGKAVDGNDYIVYNTTSGVLSYDADGSGAGAAVQIALIGITTHPTIMATDFMVTSNT